MDVTLDIDKDVEQQIFAKIDPKLLERKIDSGEQTFRESLDKVDDYMSLSNIVFDEAAENSQETDLNEDDSNIYKLKPSADGDNNIKFVSVYVQPFY